MINLDKEVQKYKEILKRDGLLSIPTPRRPIWFKQKEFEKTKSITLAVEIVNDLKDYHILDNEEFEKLLEDAEKYQVLNNKRKEGARKTNAKLTPQQLSERNRKAAIARWNKTPKNIIKDIK